MAVDDASDELDAVRFEERWLGMLDLSGDIRGGIRGGGSCQSVGPSTSVPVQVSKVINTHRVWLLRPR